MKAFLLTIMISAVTFSAFAGKKEIKLTVAKYLYGDLDAYSNFADEMKTETDLGYCIRGILDAKTNLLAENYDWDRYHIFIGDDRSSGHIKLIMNPSFSTPLTISYSGNNFNGTYDSCKKIISDRIKNYNNQKVSEGLISGGTPRSADIFVRIPESAAVK